MASLKDTNILGKLVVTDKIIKSGGTSNDILLANGDTITKSALSGQITNNTTYTFENGTNCFYVTPSDGTKQTVTVTPSITNNITGSGTSGYLTKFNGANTITNGPALGTDTTKYLRNDGTWAVPPGTTAAQIQSDWNQTDSSKLDYIKNKPTIPSTPDLSGYVTLSTLQTISGKKVFSANHGGSSTITSDLDAIKLAAVSRDATKGTYFPGIGWNNLEIWNNNTYVGGAQAWIGTRLVDTAGSERVDLVFATKEDNTSGPIRPIERMCITYQGNVGIGIKEPSSLLHVNGKIKASDLEVTSILAPTTSGGTTYGVGSNGQVLKSNGTSVYWGADSSGTTFTLPTRLADYSTSGYADANEATAQGWHYMTTTATNRPPFKQSSNKDYRIMSTAYSASWVQQIATDFRGNDMFLRRRENGTWKPWTPIVRFQDCTTDHKMQTITDNAIPRWDTGGTAMLQNSTATISDNGHLTINTTSDTTMTTPAINVLHTGPANGSSTADLMILSGYNSAPYGFKFSTHGSGTAIIQSQRINKSNENFNLSLNPNGGDVLINGNKAATENWVSDNYVSRLQNADWLVSNWQLANTDTVKLQLVGTSNFTTTSNTGMDGYGYGGVYAYKNSLYSENSKVATQEWCNSNFEMLQDWVTSNFEPIGSVDQPDIDEPEQPPTVTKSLSVYLTRASSTSDFESISATATNLNPSVGSSGYLYELQSGQSYRAYVDYTGGSGVPTAESLNNASVGSLTNGYFSVSPRTSNNDISFKIKYNELSVSIDFDIISSAFGD